jgi:cytochrome c5
VLESVVILSVGPSRPSWLVKICDAPVIMCSGVLNLFQHAKTPHSYPDSRFFEDAMSANDNHTSHEEAHEEAHTGPIKTPQQLLAAVFFSFVVPIFAIIGLVYYVTSANKTAPGAVDTEKAVAMRIQKIGSVEIRDANRALKSGEEVYKAQCTTCHAAGVANAPKFGDTGAWAARIKTGYDALLTSALKGKGAMGAQGGGDYEDTEIGRAVVYMTNAAGAKFAEPAGPAAAATTAAAPAAAPVAAVAAAPVAPAPAAAPAAAVKVAASASGNGEALYKQVCTACHAQSVAGSPKFGDKAAWAPRIKTGIDALTASVIKGKGAMPPKGGSAASEADIRATVEYMVNAAK